VWQKSEKACRQDHKASDQGSGYGWFGEGYSPLFPEVSSAPAKVFILVPILDFAVIPIQS
jgi:hypothetical protein